MIIFRNKSFSKANKLPIKTSLKMGILSEIEIDRKN
jgi:hypothetical protein